MRLPWLHRTPERTPAEHAEVLADLDDKDKIIDDLLLRADDLVSELRVSLGNASAALRNSPGEAGH